MMGKNTRVRTRDPVPVAIWGEDHWSTFAYIATRVGGDGEPDKNKMRTDVDRHPGLAGQHMAYLHAVDTTKYPTRLKGGVALTDHDDWDCVEDAIAAGLLLWGGTGLHPVFALTDRGWVVLREIVTHKNTGGTFAEFVPSPAALEAA